jgi:hypothetical protein
MDAAEVRPSSGWDGGHPAGSDPPRSGAITKVIDFTSPRPKRMEVKNVECRLR